MNTLCGPKLFDDGHRVEKMLQRSLYAGYITIPKWKIHLQPAKHEPLIDFQTWRRIQDRLEGNAYAPARKDLNADFPLRGFVTCTCGQSFTAAWSKGRNQYYAYYTCQKKGCENIRKSILKDQIEGEFEDLLHSLKPAPILFRTAWDILADL